MERTIIATKNAPAALGPYAQANKLGGFVFTSGQLGIDPAVGELVSGGVEAQAEQVMKNISELLKAAGSDFSCVVKTTIFLAHMNDFAAVNEIYGKYFDANALPSRSTVAVKTLPKDALVEIETIAYSE